MRDALEHLDVRIAIACFAVVVAAGLFATALIPRDGWASIAPMVVVVCASIVVGGLLLARAGMRGAPRGQLLAILAIAVGASLLSVLVAGAGVWTSTARTSTVPAVPQGISALLADTGTTWSAAAVTDEEAAA